MDKAYPLFLCLCLLPYDYCTHTERAFDIYYASLSQWVERGFIPGNVPAKRTESSRRKRCVILRSRKREEREGGNKRGTKKKKRKCFFSCCCYKRHDDKKSPLDPPSLPPHPFILWLFFSTRTNFRFLFCLSLCVSSNSPPIHIGHLNIDSSIYRHTNWKGGGGAWWREALVNICPFFLLLFLFFFFIFWISFRLQDFRVCVCVMPAKDK